MTTRNPSKAEELKRTHRPVHRSNGFRVSSEEAALMQGPSLAAEAKPSAVEESGRERLKRHRVEVAGRVWIPDIWGQEELLKGLPDCNAFDASLMNSSILSARAALVEEVRTANSGALRIENSVWKPTAKS
ncbi:hypothetical protein RJ640_005120 [Escallonia rubra]|uniref:Uncharacterized protein n=1 Tax=Escallonia rubra TaxID=112253 RepID=A0AA88RNZ8_9ASTE|nr:hypothetical protein RJ640_005120 [Escallonia rubra]